MQEASGSVREARKTFPEHFFENGYGCKLQAACARTLQSLVCLLWAVTRLHVSKHGRLVLAHVTLAMALVTAGVGCSKQLQALSAPLMQGFCKFGDEGASTHSCKEPHFLTFQNGL